MGRSRAQIKSNTQLTERGFGVLGIKVFNTQAESPLLLEKGGEMGRFKLGSTVILLFPEGNIEWSEHLKQGTPVRMGEAIATTL